MHWGGCLWANSVDVAPCLAGAKVAPQVCTSRFLLWCDFQVHGPAGMAGVLHLLKDRGELTQRMQWAGRTNDMKPVMLQGLEDVYQSGAHADEIANRVELALTRRDEYGRVLTPKQAFREVSYR